MTEIPDSVAAYTHSSISTIHHTLQASRRRIAIGLIAHRALTAESFNTSQTAIEQSAQRGELRVSVKQLAKEIAAIEEDVSVENATGEPYHNVYTSLIQTHLPKLDEVGAVRYNDDRKVVQPDENLIAFSVVAAVTSPIVQVLFHTAVADFHRNGRISLEDSITD